MIQRSIGRVVALAVVASLCSVMYFSTAHAFPPAQAITLGKPTLSCVDSSLNTIKLQVCAGTDGSPFGFSVQWIKCDDYAKGPDGILGTTDDNSWPSSDSPIMCKASFSGRPAYNGVPGCDSYTLVYDPGCTNPASYFEATIGSLDLDACGASSNCNDELDCGTCYRFRAFSHAGVHPDTGQKYRKSAFSVDITCETEPCPPPGGPDQCTWSQGFWKNHDSAVTTVFNMGADCNGGCGMKIGTGSVAQCGNTPSCYDRTAIGAILNRNSQGGNHLATLGRQYVAARLNLIYNGGYNPVLSNGKTVTENLADADLLIGTRNMVTDSANSSAMNAVAGILEAYNVSLEHAIGCIDPHSPSTPDLATGAKAPVADTSSRR